MAEEIKETVLLEFTVDQGAAERDLVKIEGLILDNKKAQQELAKAYKAGNITQKEYIQENIRLQQNIKKEQEQKNILVKTLNTESNSRNAIKLRISQLTREYDNLNRSTAAGAKRADELEKELTQLNAQITKTSKSAGLFKDQIGNYPSQFGEAIKSINVAGVSVGDLATKFTTFAGGATAVVGLLGSIAGAYASSATGARDLEAAQIQLSAAYQVAGEEFAQFLNAGEDSIGVVEGISIALLSRYVPAIYATSEAYAAAAKSLKDLEISRAFAAGDAKNDERRAEILRRIRDDESAALDDRIEASSKIDEILETSKQRTIIILQAEAEAIRKSTVGYDKNREAQLRVAQITAEIADKEEEITGKLTENVTARRELVKLQQEALFLLEQELREANKPNVSVSPEGSTSDNTQSGAGLKDPAIQASEARQKQFIAELDTVRMTEAQKQEYYRQSYLIKKQQDQDIYDSSRTLFNGLAALAAEGSKEQKALALINIGVNTAEALAGGIAASQDIPYPGNIAATLNSVAVILANIAAAKQYISGFAEGGYTGAGAKYDVAGVVHKGEYVAPKHIVESPMAQGHLRALERMRTGYADGGFVTNQNTNQASQALIMANALKNLPTPVVSVKEVSRVQERIRVKENVSNLSNRQSRQPIGV